MKSVKVVFLSSALSLVFSVLAVYAPSAGAENISSFTSVVGPSATAQLGRLSRNSVQQDWTGLESFPGVLNPTAKYYYQTYSFASSLFAGAPYVTFSVFDETNAGNSFVSAYSGSYNSTNLMANWLGDEGGSGDYFGTDARYFDVILPAGQDLVLVVNTTVLGGGPTSSPFDIVINAYADTSYDDPTAAPVPEPSTFVLLATGLAGMAGAVRRRVTSRS